MKKSKGITLIALVITIIIMLILVAVTVSYGIKSGLLSKAKEGTFKYKYKEEEEKIGKIQLSYKVDKETNNTKDKSLFDYLLAGLLEEADVFLDGEEIKVKYKKTGNEHIIKQENYIGEEKKSLTDLQKYILGDDGKGRPYSEILDGVNFKSDGKYLDSQYLSFIIDGSDEAFLGYDLYTNGSKEGRAYYLKYQKDDENRIYKFVIDEEEGKTIPLGNDLIPLIWDEQANTKVGKKVYWDSDCDEEQEEWIILYDDAKHGVQIISKETYLYNEAFFYIGDKDSYYEKEGWPQDITDKDIYSYNNIINNLNKACKSLIINSSLNYDVRCVGSNPINKNLEGNNITNEKVGEVFNSDNNFIEDYDRIVALKMYNTDYAYWCASRCIETESGKDWFCVRKVNSDGYLKEEIITKTKPERRQ